MTQRVNWRQVFAEVGLLLVGALLALSADAFWIDRQDSPELVITARAPQGPVGAGVFPGDATPDGRPVGHAAFDVRTSPARHMVNCGGNTRTDGPTGTIEGATISGIETQSVCGALQDRDVTGSAP